MESAGLMCEKFIKLLSHNDTQSDNLVLPIDFFMEYIDTLSEKMFLVLRNGYELPVTLDKAQGVLRGLSDLFADFNLTGGEILFFEYFGRRDMNVYVIGGDQAEIYYPNIVHSSQRANPRSVSIRRGGWKMVQFMNPTEPGVDGLEVPASFLERITNPLKGFIRYVLSNGKKVDGLYKHDTGMITGLKKICAAAGIPDFREVPILVFTFDGLWSLNVATFDENFMEIKFPGTPMSAGPDGIPVDVVFRFDIVIYPFHLYNYCHGVDIPVEFRDLCLRWDKTDYIHVYYDNLCWRLQIKHRHDWKRTTIHDGWLEFRKHLNLKVGDICVFEGPDNCYDHFTVRVIHPSP